MTPIISLRLLTEPAYALVGSVIPGDDPTGEVRLLVSRQVVMVYPPQARPLLEYLSVVRSESDVLDQVARWGGTPSELADLVREGLLIQLPANDEDAVREAVEGLTLWMAAEAMAAPGGQSVLLCLSTDRAVAISPVTAAVLELAVILTLGAGVHDVSQRTGIPKDQVWRSVVHDLTAILSTGAGNLLRVGADP